MNVAVLGLGFMGAAHVKAWGSVSGVRLAGVMSSSASKRSGDLTAVGGNLGETGARFDFGDARRFDSVAAALADPAIDAVDICLPTDLHAAVALRALRAGKHVLVEKPMALGSAEAEAMAAEAVRAGKILMVGHVLRFIPAYRLLAEKLQGRPVFSAVFRRECGEPGWSGWLPDRSRSGGAALDLLIHDLDFCISVWGMPEFIRASGEGLGELFQAELVYAGLGPVRVEGGWHADPAFPFSMGFDVRSGAGRMEWSSAEGAAFRITEPGGVAAEPELPETDIFLAEMRYFAGCVAEGRQPEFCPPSQSARAVALARFMLESRGDHGKYIRAV